MNQGEIVAQKYRLLRPVAVGGMGWIWLARNENTQAEVIVKILRHDLPARLRVAERFRHEAHVGAILHHPGIARTFDLLEEPNGSLILVMEYLRGETLRGLLRRKKAIPIAEMISVMATVLEALSHAHEKKIIHRDIKPTNIFLEADDRGLARPKLLDFGIARSEADLKTAMGDVLGTPQYMAPEQIRAESLDGRVDLFSLTTVFYECLTGSNPFRSKTSSAALAAVLENPVDPDPSIPPALWLVIQRGFAKQPYERFSSAEEYRTELLEAARQAGVTPRPPAVEPADAFFDTSESGREELAESAIPSSIRQEEPQSGWTGSDRPPRTHSWMNPKVLAVAASLLVLFGLGLSQILRSKRESESSLRSGKTSELSASSLTSPQVPVAGSSTAERGGGRIDQSASNEPVDLDTLTPTKPANKRSKPSEPAALSPAKATATATPAKKKVATKPDF